MLEQFLEGEKICKAFDSNQLINTLQKQGTYLIIS